MQLYSELQRHPFLYLLSQGLCLAQLFAPFCCHSCCHHGNGAVTTEKSDFVLLAWIAEVTPQPKERFTCQGTKTEQSLAEGPSCCSIGWMPPPRLGGAGGTGQTSIRYLTLLFQGQITKSMAIICASAPPICVTRVVIPIYLTGHFEALFNSLMC